MEHFKYILIENDTIKEYPYSIPDLKKNNPNISFPDVISDTDLEYYGVFKVQLTSQPSFDKRTHKCIEINPKLVSNVWSQQWELQELSDLEIREYIENFKNEAINSVQQRLDNFAKTKNYDNILSLCSYSSSSNPQFKKEGEYGVFIRDETWSFLFHILEEIETGKREIPNSYKEIEVLLPNISWPINN